MNSDRQIGINRNIINIYIYIYIYIVRERERERGNYEVNEVKVDLYYAGCVESKRPILFSISVVRLF